MLYKDPDTWPVLIKVFMIANNFSVKQSKILCLSGNSYLYQHKWIAANMLDLDLDKIHRITFITKGRRDLASSGLLHSECWEFLTDIWGQPIVPIFKCQGLLIPEDEIQEIT